MTRPIVLKAFTFSVAVVLSLLSALPAMAAGWGSVKGRFVVDGKAPEPPALLVDKDQFCIDNKPTNDAILVGEGGALQNVIVYLRLPRTGKVEAHPDYAAKLKEPVVLDNKGCHFEPRVTLVQVGQTLRVTNSDPTGHNTNISVFSFNPVVPSNGKIEVKATKESRLPEQVKCNIHPFMTGYLLSQKHPYMAVTGEDGAFEIKNLPAGKHELQLWHEAVGYLKDVATKGGKADRTGRVDVTIAADKTLDLGDIKVPASLLKPR
jgi:plastocyanin